jgi:hypothetical protein
MTTDQCVVVRRIADRENCRLTLANPETGFIRAYLKRHRTPQPKRFLNNGAEGFIAPGLAEADAVGRCQRAGVPTMDVIAAGQTLDEAAGWVDSFFMSEEISNAKPADELWTTRFGSAKDIDFLREDRLRFLDALADAARRFHAAGLFHRDFYWCHFFVREAPRGRFNVQLIDLQRVSGAERLPARWILKDLAQFRFSMPSDLTADEQSYWFRRYLGVDKLSWSRRCAHRIIGWRAALYRWKEESQ